MIESNTEQAIAADFVTHRRLFGDAYSRLMPDYFWDMPAPSGVFVLLFIPVTVLDHAAKRPGDVDLLVVPYEGDELVLDRTLAVELKVVRASFLRPGRSPNEFGVSQATALQALGFPHVALAHLIVSDQSPSHAWQEMTAFKVLNANGSIGEPLDQRVDTLPVSLIERAYGRLLKACPHPEIGLLSAFVRYAAFELAEQYKHATWFAEGRGAAGHPHPNTELLERIGDLFEARPEWWFDNPRHSKPA